MSDPAILRERRTGVQLRIATLKDAAEIAAVLRQSFAEFEDLYTPDGFAATVLNPQRVRQRMEEGPTWVAVRDEDTVGTVSSVPAGSDTLYIRSMAVLPATRGQHIGYTLLSTVQAYAVNSSSRRMLLSTTPFLTAAIRLYERFGFERTSDEPHELFGTPLFSMSKELSGANEFVSHS